jgi:HD-like signal output (HDOD) protein
MDRQEALKTIAAEAVRGELVFPTSAKVALRVRQLLDDPDCQLEAAARMVRAEPVLSARVVAIANSMAFNRSGHTITNVRAAVTRVGFRTIRALATAVVTRQMAGAQDQPGVAAQLWEHTAHVAALAQVIARRITRQDPETAMFAGMIHEVGGFYLLSQANNFPGLLDGSLTDRSDEDDETEGEFDGEGEIGRAVLKALSVPEPVVAAIEVLWKGYLTYPPTTLGDTLLLADQLAPVKSPLLQASGANREGMAATIDMIVGEETLAGILKESTAEVNSLIHALQF